MIIGEKKYRGTAKYIWLPCRDCGKERWVHIESMSRPNYGGRCKSCHAKYRPHYPKYAGRFLTSEGYVKVALNPKDFFYSMAKKDGYILEHRLVMARYTGRCLHSWELVHHKGDKFPKGSRENRSDNRIENLQLVTDDRHKQITILENQIGLLEQRIKRLEAENLLLRSDQHPIVRDVPRP